MMIEQNKLSERILNVEIDPDNGHMTIKDMLESLLLTLWKEGESFSSKRPFGNSGWEYDLYVGLVRAGLVDGKLDSDRYIEDVDEIAAHRLISNTIMYIFNKE